MGVLPLQFPDGESAAPLALTGEEVYSMVGIEGVEGITTHVMVSVAHQGETRQFETIERIDTPADAAYCQHGGILEYVLRQLLSS